MNPSVQPTCSVRFEVMLPIGDRLISAPATLSAPIGNRALTNGVFSARRQRENNDVRTMERCACAYAAPRLDAFGPRQHPPSEGGSSRTCSKAAATRCASGLRTVNQDVSATKAAAVFDHAAVRVVGAVPVLEGVCDGTTRLVQKPCRTPDVSDPEITAP